MKATLNKNVRIKGDKNSELLLSIEKKISEKIRSEFIKEIASLKLENNKLYEEEKKFKEEARKILLKIDTDTKLKVTTQVGVGSKVIQKYEGTLERKFQWSDGTFNFIDKKAYDGKPFTIGFSCLQSIEVLK